MNHEQQIEDLQRDLIRVERENRILREANAVAGDELRNRKDGFASGFFHASAIAWLPWAAILIFGWPQ